IAVHDLVVVWRREELMHKRLHGGLAGQLVLRRHGIGREHRAPESRRAVGRDLEAIAPCAGAGEVAARAVAEVVLKIERRGEYDEAFGPGEAVEGDARLLAHGAAAAVGTNDVSTLVRFLA